MSSNAYVKFNCAVCKQNIRIGAEKIELIISKDGNMSASYMCTNTTCPSAGASISAEVGEDSATILKQKNARTTDNRKGKGTPPINHNDILDFHESLEESDIQNEPWFKKLVPSVRKIVQLSYKKQDP